jgi:hypothetical protein
MRLGAKEHEATVGDWFQFDTATGAISATCALGAAAVGAFGILACGKIPYLFPEVRLFVQFPELGNLANCPGCGSVHPDTQVVDIVIHLNDDLHWTREQIADWLETL